MKSLKIHLIIIILLLCITSLHSQSISIELSVKWEKGTDVYNEDSIIYVPKLSITYRNNSDTNFYFKKVSESRSGLPFFRHGSLLQYPIEEYLNPNYLKRAKAHGNYTNENYKVEIKAVSFTNSWFLFNDTLNIEEEQEIDIVNDDLANIYEYIYRENYNKQPNYFEQTKIDFTEFDLTPDKILNEYSNKFIFLRAGEIYTDSYNLIGFQMIKGSFMFYISIDSLTDYIYTTPIWDNNQSKYVETKTMLPKLVGEYKLYSGKFNTNKISITF